MFRPLHKKVTIFNVLHSYNLSENLKERNVTLLGLFSLLVNLQIHNHSVILTEGFESRRCSQLTCFPQSRTSISELFLGKVYFHVLFFDIHLTV
jgi:hypothetical protein